MIASIFVYNNQKILIFIETVSLLKTNKISV